MKNLLIIRSEFLFMAMGVVSLGLLCHSPARAANSGLAYFPWAKGDTWVYKTVNKDKDDTFEMKVSMDGPWKEGDASGMIMTQKDSRGTMSEFQTANEKGIFIAKLGLSKALTPEVFTVFNPPVPRVIFPLVPGTKVHWEGRLKVAWVNKVVIFDGEVTGFEDLDVPAGHFHCIKLHYREKRGDEVINEDAWYAQGVGQVKYAGGKYVKELKTYRIGGSEKGSVGDTAK